MSRIVLVTLLILSSPAQAYHWVQFEPCGFEMPEAGELIPDTKPAPNYTTMYIHRDHVLGAFEADTRPGQKGPTCSVIVLSSGIRRPVVGSLKEVMRKLRGGP